MVKPEFEVIEINTDVILTSGHSECNPDCTVVGPSCTMECSPVCTDGYTCSSYE